jgi:MerR family transcriptional regulator, thiopeptide resistance regulator
MDEMFDIGDVARATGLTQRALRFYEARGLVSPLRTAAGRRVYGRGDLARLNAAVALKRAGFSLQRIGELLAGRDIDLARLVAAQLARIDAQAAALADARSLLVSVQSRIDNGEPIDVATICSLIRTQETIMNATEWKPVIDDYFTPDAQQRFRATMPDDFDQEAYSRHWRDLGGRIEAALPLDPASLEAQAFVDDWFALLKPFSDVATPAMWNGVAGMYDDRSNWKAEPEMGFSHAVWTFIRAATQARLDVGGTVDGPRFSAGE